MVAERRFADGGRSFDQHLEIGRPRTEAEASLRLRLGRDTSAAEVERAIDVILNAVAAARV